MNRAAFVVLAVAGVGLGLSLGRGLRLDADDQVKAPAVSKPAAPPSPDARPPLSDRPDDEKALRELLGKFVTTYNAARAQDLAPLFTEEAALIDGEGTATRGRNAIIQKYQAAFDEGPVAQLQGQVTALRFLTPDVVQADGDFALFAGKPDESETVQTGRYALLALRHDKQWRIAEIRDYPDPAPEPASNYEKLQELEWMVGDWVDESENVKSTTSVRWAENRNFLVRTYTVEISGEPAMSGTQWIGWDPQAGQIKSWLFDSEGGHSEGLWTRLSDKQWIIKTHGTLRDGRATSATQVIDLLSKDAARLSALDRIVGGELAPDLDELIMVRRPPAPSVTPEATRR